MSGDSEGTLRSFFRVGAWLASAVAFLVGVFVLPYHDEGEVGAVEIAAAASLAGVVQWLLSTLVVRPVPLGIRLWGFHGLCSALGVGWLYFNDWRGVYTWEGRVCYLSTAHTDDDVERIGTAICESAAELARHGLLEVDPSAPSPSPSPSMAISISPSAAESAVSAAREASAPVALERAPVQVIEPGPGERIGTSASQREIWFTTHTDPSPTAMPYGAYPVLTASPAG